MESAMLHEQFASGYSLAACVFFMHCNYYYLFFD